MDDPLQSEASIIMHFLDREMGRSSDALQLTVLLKNKVCFYFSDASFSWDFFFKREREIERERDR